jgi:hypothetical protein
MTENIEGWMKDVEEALEFILGFGEQKTAENYYGQWEDKAQQALTKLHAAMAARPDCLREAIDYVDNDIEGMAEGVGDTYGVVSEAATILDKGMR